MPETIPHWLTKQANIAPDQTAIELENETSLTFLELKEKSQHFAQKLAQLDIKQGSHVAILSNNNVDMVIAIHALSYLGAVAVMLNTRLTEKELAYQISDAEVSHVLAENNNTNFSVPVYTFSKVNSLQEKIVELRKEINLGDRFTIIYTSGTTGFPKGVVHTYGNHWWSAIGSMLNLGLNNNDKWLNALPIFHVGGLSIFVKSVIYGMPVYLVDKYDKRSVHDAIMSKGVTIVSVVTLMLRELVEYLGDNLFPDTFRCVLLGGGPAPKSLLEQAKFRNVPVFQSYGMTETSSQIVTLSPNDALDKIGSSGKPLFPAQLKIDALDKSIGEIFVKGPMVTSGYFKNEAATEKTLNDGWLATGDLGYLDDDGFLYVVDRRKDLIISGGENIYPTEIESVLSEMDAVQEVGVVGRNDDRWGQVPIAFVVTNDKSVSAEVLLEFASQKLAKYKLPKEIHFIDKLPRNASNKIVKNKLL
ncbi:o-succinylbenzoate--CoA ligase [Virgibacillus litoralis]|uniref:2-succinylbenzoate--CoA ligase n=1 Tax=Virgibacillus litoralis TaxID=578221 RepID=A0ABS4HHB4_9BACI|nr:o-succinylbenzoate--CoA ligase [Virgibacillus litoralis]MBP1950322.1 O-succinylbenzoic acid--CoA ligase [Virgibacillus litoralis]